MSHTMQWDMVSVLDDKRRVVLPRDVVEELGLKEGSEVAFENRKGVVIMKKVGENEDPLRQAMSWNPKRVRKPEPIREKEIKEMWG